MSMSGPPELPGLIGAEVWSRPLKSISPPFSVGIGSERLNAETTPTVTVCCSCSGSPIAIAHWPCSSRVESASSQRRRKLRVAVHSQDADVSREVVREDVRRHVVAVREDDRQLRHVSAVGRLQHVGVGDDVAAAVDHEAGARGLAAVRLHDAGPLAAKELLEERIGRDDLLAVDLFRDCHDRRLRALDRADDAILVADAAQRHRGDGGRSPIGAGRAAEVTARVEHHKEAADNGAHESHDQAWAVLDFSPS